MLELIARCWAGRCAAEDITNDFLVRCLSGSCIHSAEKNVEMILSLIGSPLLTVRHVNTRDMWGNTAISMTIEGYYHPSREHIVNKLLECGAQVGPGIDGG